MPAHNLPSLHPAQVRIRNEAARFNVLACGRRFGKTTLGELLLVLIALEGMPVVWFAPFYKMLAEVFRDLKRLLAGQVSRVVASEHRLELSSGGVIDCWSLDNPNVSRGRKYARAIVDEAAMIPQLEEAWQAVIRPTLTDYEGDAFFLSTPKGINFFHQLYTQGQDREREAWRSWSFPTTANPWINPAEVESARADLPELVFRQEYLAEFINQEGEVFRNFDSILTLETGEPEEHAGHLVVGGVDWAQVADRTAVSIFCADCLQELDIDYFNRLPWQHQRDRIAAVCERWGVALLYCEQNSIGSPNIEALEEAGLPVKAWTTTSQSKAQMVQALALSFEKNESRWLADRLARAELEAFEVTLSPQTNMPRYGHPPGGRDDTVIARCLAYQAAILAARYRA